MYQPEIDWPFALDLTRRFQGELPEVTRPDAHRAVAQMRRAAVKAGSLASRRSRLGGEPANRIAVVDRVGWARGAAVGAEHLLGTLGLQRRPAGVGQRISRLAYGFGGGLALAVASRALLGQYDAFGPRPTLHLIAPNLVSMARRMPGPPEQFYLWVAVHEQTHALQFSSVEWLPDYALGLFHSVAEDEAHGLDMVRGLAAGRGAAGALVSEEGHVQMEKLRAMMTLLEGHADLISDSVGVSNIRHGKAFRRRFQSMRRTSPRWQRLLPAGDKHEQYRLGLEFCLAVRRRVGIRGLNRAFTAPEALPDMAELRDPQRWLDRMHGTA